VACCVVDERWPRARRVVVVDEYAPVKSLPETPRLSFTLFVRVVEVTAFDIVVDRVSSLSRMPVVVVVGVRVV